MDLSVAIEPMDLSICKTNHCSRESYEKIKQDYCSRELSSRIKPGHCYRKSNYTIKPDHYSWESSSRIKNDQYPRESNNVIKPDDYSRESNHIIKPDDYTRESNHIIKPDHYSRESNNIIKPDYYSRESNNIIKPDHYSRESNDIVKPDHYSRKSNNIIKSDQYSRESNHIIKPDHYSRESNHIVKPDHYSRELNYITKPEHLSEDSKPIIKHDPYYRESSHTTKPVHCTRESNSIINPDHHSRKITSIIKQDHFSSESNSGIKPERYSESNFLYGDFTHKLVVPYLHKKHLETGCFQRNSSSSEDYQPLRSEYHSKDSPETKLYQQKSVNLDTSQPDLNEVRNLPDVGHDERYLKNNNDAIKPLELEPSSHRWQTENFLSQGNDNYQSIKQSGCETDSQCSESNRYDNFHSSFIAFESPTRAHHEEYDTINQESINQEELLLEYSDDKYYIRGDLLKSEASTNAERCKKYRKSRADREYRLEKEMILLKRKNARLQKKRDELKKQIDASFNHYIRLIQDGQVHYKPRGRKDSPFMQMLLELERSWGLSTS